jgi:nicotinamidase-related amidase
VVAEINAGNIIQKEDGVVLKEAYFTKRTIDMQAAALLAAVSEAGKRHFFKLPFRPESAALLVLDMQEYFLDEQSHAFIPSAPAILPKIVDIVEAFKQAGRPVIFTRHGNNLDNAGMMAKWWRDLIDPHGAHSQITSSFDLSKAMIFDKTQYDAFHNTSLDNCLRDLGCEQVAITGVMTHLCCETTARSAFMRGFEVYFPVDCTATYNKALHQASLLTLSHGFAIPVLAEQIKKEINIYDAA